MIRKSDEQIELIDASYIKGPFNDWKQNIHKDNKKMIAAIPFVRNLIEYTKGKDAPNYSQLTSILHIKNTSSSMIIQNLEAIFKNEFNNPSLSLPNPNDNVLALIFRLADECVTENECPNLENKIILSIAIRLKAEAFMISKINDKPKTDAISSRQTVKGFPQNKMLIF